MSYRGLKGISCVLSHSVQCKQNDRYWGWLELSIKNLMAAISRAALLASGGTVSHVSADVKLNSHWDTHQAVRGTRSVQWGGFNESLNKQVIRDEGSDLWCLLLPTNLTGHRVLTSQSVSRDARDVSGWALPILVAWPNPRCRTPITSHPVQQEPYHPIFFFF